MCPSSCVTPAGTSTCLTSRINGMTTHIHTAGTGNGAKEVARSHTTAACTEQKHECAESRYSSAKKQSRGRGHAKKAGAQLSDFGT